VSGFWKCRKYGASFAYQPEQLYIFLLQMCIQHGSPFKTFGEKKSRLSHDERSVSILEPIKRVQRGMARKERLKGRKRTKKKKSFFGNFRNVLVNIAFIRAFGFLLLEMTHQLGWFINAFVEKMTRARRTKRILGREKVKTLQLCNFLLAVLDVIITRVNAEIAQEMAGRLLRWWYRSLYLTLNIFFLSRSCRGGRNISGERVLRHYSRNLCMQRDAHRQMISAWYGNSFLGSFHVSVSLFIIRVQLMNFWIGFPFHFVVCLSTITTWYSVRFEPAWLSSYSTNLYNLTRKLRCCCWIIPKCQISQFEFLWIRAKLKFFKKNLSVNG